MGLYVLSLALMTELILMTEILLGLGAGLCLGFCSQP